MQSSSGELTRLIGVDTDPVNWSWLCDKGRFDFEAVTQRRTGSPCPWSARATSWSRPAGPRPWTWPRPGWRRPRASGGGVALAVIGGARLPNEDAYAWAKAARVALGTDNVDAQLGDGLPAETVLGLPRATIDQAAAGAAGHHPRRPTSRTSCRSCTCASATPCASAAPRSSS